MESGSAQMVFSKNEELDCFLGLRSSLVKLLYMIEGEALYIDASHDIESNNSIDLWFTGLMFDLKSSNLLCHNKLTKVIVKIYGLYDHSQYKTMKHGQIKRQIFEARGILDHLIEELGGPVNGGMPIKHK